MHSPNEILFHRYEVFHRIGHGTFSDLYLGRDIEANNQFVAIKIQEKNCKAEAEVLQNITRSENSDVTTTSHDGGDSSRIIPSFPKFIFYQQLEGIKEKHVLVMELYKGENLAELRDHLRSKSNGYISVAVTTYIIRQLLRLIQKLHENEYVSRDIKPSNFVRHSPEDTLFGMVDFGLAKSLRDKQGNLRKPRNNCEFRGTTIYASHYALTGYEQCRRDDLLSLFYILIDFICEKLPWTEQARRQGENVDNARQEVIESKVKYASDIEALLDWMNEQVKLYKEQNASLQLSHQFNIEIRSCCKQFFTHLNSLQYEDTPDYELLYLLLKKMNTAGVHDSVLGNVGYTEISAIWKVGIDHIQTVPVYTAKHHQHILLFRLENIVFNIPTTQHAVQAAEVVQKEWLVGVKWLDLARELLTIHKEEVDLSTVDTFLAYVREQQYFLRIQRHELISDAKDALNNGNINNSGNDDDQGGDGNQQEQRQQHIFEVEFASIQAIWRVVYELRTLRLFILNAPPQILPFRR